MSFAGGQAKASTRHHFGFSSTELLLSLLVGTVLAVSISTRFEDRSAMTADSEIRQDLDEIATALRRYHRDNNVYPTNAQGLDALIQRPGNLPLAPHWRDGGYLERMPLDPWGQRYHYLHPGLHGEFDVYSLGADDAPGGEGENSDLGNWTG